MSLPTELLPDPLPRNPLTLASEWLEEAWRRRVQPNPDAMVLASLGAEGQPSARVVLCKAIVPDPGYLLFYSNYDSRKGRELAQHERVAVVMHWDTLHRQLRVEGTVARSPAAESDAYFATRPWQRQVGAWASEQSQPIRSRAELVSRVVHTAHRLGAPVPGTESDPVPAGLHIARPPHWGGYRVHAHAVELWAEGESRIHDRVRWTRAIGDSQAPWHAERLQP